MCTVGPIYTGPPVMTVPTLFFSRDKPIHLVLSPLSTIGRAFTPDSLRTGTPLLHTHRGRRVHFRAFQYWILLLLLLLLLRFLLLLPPLVTSAEQNG